jgi:hypothetical protein
MTAHTIVIPAEYQAFDYGFSGVDSPEIRVEVPVAVSPSSPELEEKIDDLGNKIDALSKLMYRLEETDNENTSEAELRDKIRMLEAITVPLLNNLLKTADKSYIFWPNRGPTIEKQLQKVLEITRGK